MSEIDKLRQLEKTGKYVFHGSINKLDVLEPRQAHHKGKPDGEPAVCAADTLDVAIFMALYRGSQFLIDPPSKSGTDDDYYYATRNVIEKARIVTGYIHVLPKDGFNKFRGEMRAYQPVTPTEIIPVTVNDFPHAVEEISVGEE